jgi:hypothetical protein
MSTCLLMNTSKARGAASPCRVGACSQSLTLRPLAAAEVPPDRSPSTSSPTTAEEWVCEATQVQ